MQDTTRYTVQPNTQYNQRHNINATKRKHWSSICSQLCISPWFGQSALHKSALTANACVWHTMECILHLLQCNKPFLLPWDVTYIFCAIPVSFLRASDQFLQHTMDFLLGGKYSSILKYSSRYTISATHFKYCYYYYSSIHLVAT